MVNLGVSENRGTPKSSILRGFSIIFTILFGYPLFLETPISGFSLFVTWQVSSRSWVGNLRAGQLFGLHLRLVRVAGDLKVGCLCGAIPGAEWSEPRPGGGRIARLPPPEIERRYSTQNWEEKYRSSYKASFWGIHVRISRLQKSPQHLDGFDRVACSSWKGDTCKFHASGTRGSSEGLPFKLEQKSYLVLVSQLIRRTACFLFALHCSAILQKSPGILFELGSSCTLFTFYYYHQQCSTWEPTWSSWFWDSCVSHQLRRCSRVKLWSH